MFIPAAGREKYSARREREIERERQRAIQRGKEEKEDTKWKKERNFRERSAALFASLFRHGPASSSVSSGLNSPLSRQSLSFSQQSVEIKRATPQQRLDTRDRQKTLFKPAALYYFHRDISSIRPPIEENTIGLAVRIDEGTTQRRILWTRFSARSDRFGQIRYRIRNRRSARRQEKLRVAIDQDSETSR